MFVFAVLPVLLLLIAAPSSEGADLLEMAFANASNALTRGDLTTAEREFLVVLKGRPNHTGAMGNLGVIYSRSGRLHEAVSMYQRALKIAPKDPALLTNLGLAYLKQENHTAAKPVFQQLVALKPEEMRFKELLATTQVYTDESLQAISLLERLPQNSNTIYLTGLAHLKLGHRERARQILDESFPSSMSAAQAAFLRGKAYYDATLFDDSVQQYRKARELDPALPAVSLELARALVSQRANEEAESELRAILKRTAYDPEASYLLGALLVQQGREEEALPLLKVARTARPEGWGTYYYLGRAKLQQNDAAGALPLLEKAAELNPRESAVFYHLSRALKAVGRDGEARKASLRVVELKRQEKKLVP